MKEIVIGLSRMTQIARFLGDEKKVFINSKGEQFFVPEALRGDCEEGDYALVIGKEYNSQAVDPNTGQGAVLANGDPDYSGPKFSRWDCLKISDYETITADYYADDVLEASKADRIKELTQSFKVGRKAVVKKGQPAAEPQVN